MNKNLILILLLLTPHLLLSNSDNNDKSPFQPSQPQEYSNLRDLIENNPKEIIISTRQPSKEEMIALKKKIIASSAKSAEKLTKEIAHSKKMALQTGMGVGFVVFIKKIGDANTHFMLDTVIAAGSIFCLISLWETLKAGYNVTRYIYKRQYCKLVLPFLDQEIEKLDSIDQKND